MFYGPIHCLFMDDVVCLIDPHRYSLYCLTSTVLFSCGDLPTQRPDVASTLSVSLFLCFICFAIDIFPNKNVSQPYFISEHGIFFFFD
jgi:hypothetical protein